MNFTNQEHSKLEQNRSEDAVFKKNIDRYFSNNMPNHEVISVCSTPYIIKIFNSSARKIVLNQKDLANAVADVKAGNRHHRGGHFIDKNEIYKLPEAIRNPVLILKGNTQNENSIILFTDMVNKKGENVFVPISLDRQKGKISVINTLYGKKNISHFISNYLSDILAVNK